MKIVFSAAIGAAALCLFTASATAQTFTTRYVDLQGSNSQALLYQPVSPKSSIALIFSQTSRNNFTNAVAQQIVLRGYNILMVDNRADGDSPDVPLETYLPSISQGVAYLRTLAGISKVVLIGQSGAGFLAAFYQNVAENGPGACSGPEKLYPCDPSSLNNLPKADGIILLDSTIGAAHNMSSIDPAVVDDGNDRNDRPYPPRIPRLDFLNPANGFNPVTQSATYTAKFAAEFYAAQRARSKKLLDDALERLEIINAGNGAFSNDEPMVVRGIGVSALGVRLYFPDIRYQAHTKSPHLVLRGDGSREVMVFQSVRSPSGDFAPSLKELGSLNWATTVRGFLENGIVRTTADYAFTEDDIKGVDWASSVTSAPSNATGIHVPALIMTMGCHYLIVPGEIIYNHLASTDKTYAGVEGATHGFTPCGAQYGDTEKRTFDYVEEWLDAAGRF
jgi:pimeloyl-ACP methyl ester carboxylesterase